MSGEGYAIVYYPTAEEIEAERQRNERERQRKEVEEKLEIEFQKLRALEESIKIENRKKEEEEKKKKSIYQEAKRLHSIEKDLYLNIEEIKKERAKRQIQTEIQSKAEQKIDLEKREKDIMVMIQTIEDKIFSIGPPLTELVEKDLTEIADSLYKIKGKIRGNYSYFESILKNLDMRVEEILELAKKKLKEENEQIKMYTNKAAELLSYVEIMISSPFVVDKEKAIQLKKTIEDTVTTGNINNIRDTIEQVTPEVKSLYNKYIEIEKLRCNQEYVMKSVQATLEEMRYNVSRLPYQTADSPKAPLYTEFDIPGGEAVKFGFGADGGLFAEVFHPKSERPTNKPDFKKQEKKWCKDYSVMLKKLKDKGFMCEEKWRRDFTDEEIEEMVGKKTDEVSVTSEEEYSRRKIQEQRRMKR